MFKFLSKNLLFTFTSIIILTTDALNAKESNCLSRSFNIKILEDITISEIINQISDMCYFSVVVKDNYSKKILSDKISGINIKNMSLSDSLNILLSENNLNYEFSNNVLKISALKTKTFKIDYITSVREGRAVTKASVDSSPIEFGENSNSKESSSDTKNQDNIISTIEKFDFWEKLGVELKAILNNTTENISAPDPIINSNAGLITITGTPSQIKRAESYIHQIQKRLKKQVVIDVSIISVELNNQYKKGVDWSKFELGFNSNVFSNIEQKGADDKSAVRTTEISTPSSFRISTNSLNFSGSQSTLRLGAALNLNIDGVLNFLETNGKTKVISSPKVTTLNNQQALITVGENINYKIQETSEASESGRLNVTYKQYSTFVGILLNLLPEVSEDNRIMLRINPSLSSLSGTTNRLNLNGERSIAPDTLQKKISTVVHVNSGDTIILGGLIDQQKSKRNTKVPLLGDIPFIGNAFKSTNDTLTTTELIFVITPRVIDIEDQKPVANSLKELGFSKSIYER
ncbi:transformation system, type II secretion system secretin protein CtsD [Campylobacter pinnipediorum subsp. pinnipediorum]|uniref:pilus (MSHA type) biogenesis protein MshL n=1 Tax=Campylobacter pinnipediorum TaxID=1965231 RepID=UPI000995AA86|nr:pilus (MSHA type) biogenesis protein MshL [Campylobacter pinnipediorum]AQW84494.1 transformation system, type II secretion system secretin protein CtsD [Campylobacter pinnipediorum subsp. pinnipediorum]